MPLFTGFCIQLFKTKYKPNIIFLLINVNFCPVLSPVLLSARIRQSLKPFNQQPVTSNQQPATIPRDTTFLRQGKSVK